MASVEITGTVNVEVCLLELWHSDMTLAEFVGASVSFCDVDVHEVSEC